MRKVGDFVFPVWIEGLLMENRIGNSHGAEIPKKSRSLDLKSLYKSGDSKESSENRSLKRKESSQEGDGEKRSNNNNKRKKSRKSLPLSSFRTVHDSDSSKSLTEVYNGGFSSKLHDPESLKKLGLSQKSNNGCTADGISVSLGNNGTKIPRRKRRFVGRKKFEDGQALKLAGRSNCKEVINEEVKLVSEDSGIQNESLKVKQDKIDDFKENRNSESISIQHLKEEDGVAGYSAVNDGDSLLRKPQRKPRKRKDSVKSDKSVANMAESLVETCDAFQEDDEENLEENAARMLSSRFDPCCTGFSSNSKVSVAPSDNGLSFLLSSGQNASSGSKNLSGSESASVDASGRILRPRKSHKEKVNSRKRRHFYEIFSGDLDADWVLNRRIKVFWPLDKNWYYGLVYDYDKERKLHHVKYDDRDEEWIDLRNERFKLLLFPSELPCKSQRKRTRRDRGSDDRIRNVKLNKENGKKNFMTEDDSSNGSYMDSEPIISWLARSTHRVKSCPSRSMKRQKTSASSLSSPGQPLSCDEAVDENGCLYEGSLKGSKVKLFNSTELPGKTVGSRRVQDSSLGSTSYPNRKHPIVYFRRRFRRTDNVLCQASKGNCIASSASESITSFVCVDEFQDLGVVDACLGRLDPERDLLFSDNAGQLQLNISLIHSKQFRLGLSFPVPSVSNNLFGTKCLWLVRTFLLLQCGTVMTVWPMVHMEILFVDNEVGVRFFLFEGSLKQAIAFVFQVLMVFYRPTEQGKYTDMQLPVTSIRFKFSCSQDFRRQIVFAFYNFHDVKHSKWMSLDSKLKKHSLLNRQLPLSDCTYDNLKALQNGTNQLLGSPACKVSSSVEGLSRRKYRQGISLMGVSRESSFLKLGQLSCNSEKLRNLPRFALSFGAAPTFFLSLHLKLLMERSLARISFGDHDSIEQPGSSGNLLLDDSSSREDSMNNNSESSVEKNLKASSKEVASDAELTSDLSVCGNGCLKKSSREYKNNDQIVDGTFAGSHESEVGAIAFVPLQKQQCDNSETQQFVLSSKSPFDADKETASSGSILSGIRVEIPPFDQYGKHVDSELPSTRQSTDLTLNMNGGIIPSPNPTAPRSTWHRNRSSSSIGFHARGWSDGKADFFHSNFGNGPKKPRTQVSYSMPLGSLDYSSKSKGLQQRVLPHKRIRRANEKRSSDVSRGSQRNLDLLSCDANVLITIGDRGWRECGVQVVLELFDHNEWKLAVKVSGSTRYSYKAHQFLQPGSTNRFTHAMMWKGGKDWILEFTDRSQWALFKEMHEECYNRNVRAASVKNIPIPGVRLIEEYDENAVEVAFVRSSSKYLRQVETDVEMALDPSRVLYDMDSDDEQWISIIQKSSGSDIGNSLELSDEMFEKSMDMFEKAAYTQQCNEFTSEEIQEVTAGVGSMKVITAIYGHWKQKRQRVGMPLIRHLQPPLWERYQQQVREWELAMSKANSKSIEKPPMFAFCMKPRGLELPNKGSKHRSQRKISVSGQSQHALGDHEGCHSFGRRSNGFLFGDEKVLYPAHNYESLEDSPLSQASPRSRDAGNMAYFPMGSDRFDKNHIKKLQRSKSKKYGSFVPSNGPQMMDSYNHRLIGKRNGIHQWNRGICEWSSQRHYFPDSLQRHGPEQWDNSDIDEFTLRDASSAAQHALKMAKFKRERAQRLLFRADLAIHKAMVALATAEAMKESSEDLNGDG
ncbi:hypothetical protein ES319_D07G044400v1 [Gossypium barbadense]|uniref:Enhancer of polycomb-like protein n=1 Tax=Gossypium barbadense TaxID=3634 RepID=A0A5J5QPU0_GOSBA|nr:hypothetical protein ES319_D07G044400v1 [Gossypium barbadense]